MIDVFRLVYNLRNCITTQFNLTHSQFPSILLNDILPRSNLYFQKKIYIRFFTVVAPLVRNSTTTQFKRYSHESIMIKIFKINFRHSQIYVLVKFSRDNVFVSVAYLMENFITTYVKQTLHERILFTSRQNFSAMLN